MDISSPFLEACSIEPALDTQAKAIQSTVKDALQRYRGSIHLDFDTSYLELQHPQTSANARGGIALVAHFDKRIIGFGLIRPSLTSFIIDHLHVSSIHQNKGLGRTILIDLIAFALQHAKNENTDQTCIEVWVDSKLDASMAFFEMFGFMKSGEQRRRLKKLPHLSEDERDASSVEICMLLLLGSSHDAPSKNLQNDDPNTP